MCMCAGQKTSLKLNERRLLDNKKLMLRYIDGRGVLELQCLYAIQSLIHKLEHPQGKLHYRAVTFYARYIKYS
jgi:hypothetical protein